MVGGDNEPETRRRSSLLPGWLYYPLGPDILSAAPATCAPLGEENFSQSDRGTLGINLNPLA